MVPLYIKYDHRCFETFLFRVYRGGNNRMRWLCKTAREDKNHPNHHQEELFLQEQTLSMDIAGPQSHSNSFKWYMINQPSIQADQIKWAQPQYYKFKIAFAFVYSEPEKHTIAQCPVVP